MVMYQIFSMAGGSGYKRAALFVRSWNDLFFLSNQLDCFGILGVDAFGGRQV